MKQKVCPTNVGCDEKLVQEISDLQASVLEQEKNIETSPVAAIVAKIKSLSKAVQSNYKELDSLYSEYSLTDPILNLIQKLIQNLMRKFVMSQRTSLTIR